MKAVVLVLICLLSFSATAQDNSLSLLQVEETSETKELMNQMKTRSLMLDWHTYTGWAAVALMGATLVTAPENTHDKDHKWVGIAAGGMYLVSGVLAYFAPKPEGTKVQPNIAIHEKLAWIHVPAMALTMWSGLQAHKEHKDKKALSFIGKSHKAWAAIATVSFGAAAVLSMDWTMKLIPTDTKGGMAWLISKTF